VLIRLHKIEGQVRGLERMVDSDAVLHRRPHPGGCDPRVAGRRLDSARRAHASLRWRTRPWTLVTTLSRGWMRRWAPSPGSSVR